MRYRFAWALLAASVTGWCWAQSPPSPTSPAVNARAKKVVEPVSKTEEAVVLKFVAAHHGELAGLLTHLRTNLPSEYQGALRDLNRARLRLAQFKERDAERYELELKKWQLESQAQLLAARLQMDPSDDLRRRLRETLAEAYDLRRSIVQRDRDRVAERMRKLDKQLLELDAKRDATLDQQFTNLTKPAKPAKKSKTTATASGREGSR